MDKLLHLRWISTVKSTAWKDPVHEQNISKTQRNVTFTALVLRNGAWLFYLGSEPKISKKTPSAALFFKFWDSKKLCPLLHSTYCLSSLKTHLDFCSSFIDSWTTRGVCVCVCLSKCVQTIKWRKKIAGKQVLQMAKTGSKSCQIRLLLWGYETYI